MSTQCQHFSEVNKVFPSTPVHKEECCFCYQNATLHTENTNPIFDTSPLLTTKSNYPKTGHNVCLTCFTGGCFTPHGHFFRHYEATKHHVLLNIKKERIITDGDTASSVIDPTKVKSLDELAALNFGNDDSAKTNTIYTAYCVTCDITTDIDPTTTPKLYESLQGIISTPDALKLVEFDDPGANSDANMGGFEQPPKECQHALTLGDSHDDQCAVNLSIAVFQDEDAKPTTPPSRTYLPYQSQSGQTKSIFVGENFLPDLSTAAKPLNNDDQAKYNVTFGEGCYNTYQCQDCDIATNLWMCMSCGYLGCARKDYDGSGGNNHAIEHNKQTGHPLVIKIATVTKDKGDIWCYSCEDAVLDSQLKQHLSVFNLNTDILLQTESTLADMQLQLNITAQFASAYNKDGYSKPLMFGSKYTGLANFGNSCYMAAILQLYFRIPNIYQRYYIDGIEHVKTCRNGRPGTCFLCNMFKLTHGLFSGEYTPRPSDENILKYIKSIFPALSAQRQRIENNGLVSTDVNSTAIKRNSTHMGDADTTVDHTITHGNENQSNKKPRDSAITGVSDDSIVTLVNQTSTADNNVNLQNGITIHSTRKLLNNKHPIFGNMKQQDAHEFFLHLRDSTHQFETTKCPVASKIDPTTTANINDGMAFKTQNVIHCKACNMTTYKFGTQYDLGLQLEDPVEIVDGDDSSQTMVDGDNTTNNKAEKDKKYQPQHMPASLSQSIGTTQELIGYRCPGCSVVSQSTSTTTLLTLPQYLMVQVKRFVVDRTTWSLGKNNAPLLETDEIDLGSVISTVAPDLNLLAKQQSTSSSSSNNTTGSSQNIDRAMYEQNIGHLQDICPMPDCLALQLLVKSKNDADSALDAFFGLDGPDHVPGCGCADSPANLTNATASAPVKEVTSADVVDPIQTTVGLLDKNIFDTATRQLNTQIPSKYKLVAFVNHLGTSVQNGHYVTHIKSTYNNQLLQLDQQQQLLTGNTTPTIVTALNYTQSYPPTNPNDINVCLSNDNIDNVNINDGHWVCYNDAKVFVNDEPPNDQAYVLFYQRVE